MDHIPDEGEEEEGEVSTRLKHVSDDVSDDDDLFRYDEEEEDVSAPSPSAADDDRTMTKKRGGRSLDDTEMNRQRRDDARLDPWMLSMIKKIHSRRRVGRTVELTL